MNPKKASVLALGALLAFSMVSIATPAHASSIVDFTASCTTSASPGGTITCTAHDNDGWDGTAGHLGNENGAFVVFTASPSSDISGPSTAWCAWDSTASTGAKVANGADCVFTGTFAGIGTSSLSNTGGAKFTVSATATGTVTFTAVDYTSGSPSSPGSVDGSDSCPSTTGNVCSVSTTITTTHGVPEFPLGTMVLLAVSLPLMLLVKRRITGA